MHDVAVVGGGPVGLAAALHAAAAGLRVVVLEPRGHAPGAGTALEGAIDKACGEGLLPGALAAVRALGVDPAGAPLTGITYVDGGGHRAEHAFRTGPGRGVRRTVLHAALAARVREVGVPVLATRVLDVVQDGARVRLTTAGAADGTDEGAGGGTAGGAGVVEARWVVGCDGLHSVVRRAAGLDGRPARRPAPDRQRFGVRRHAAVVPWTSHVEVHWGRGVEGYVTPVGPREVGVAVLGPRGTGFAEALEQLPELAAHLTGAEWTSGTRGAGPLRQRARAVASGRVLLAGDAAGYLDALTGEGLRVGLASARAAVDAVVQQRPRWVAPAYAEAWHHETRPYRVLTAGLLAATRRPAARAALVPVAAAVPMVFGAVVERLAR